MSNYVRDEESGEHLVPLAVLKNGAYIWDEETLAKVDPFDIEFYRPTAEKNEAKTAENAVKAFCLHFRQEGGKQLP